MRRLPSPRPCRLPCEKAIRFLSLFSPWAHLAGTVRLVRFVSGRSAEKKGDPGSEKPESPPTLRALSKVGRH